MHTNGSPLFCAPSGCDVEAAGKCSLHWKGFTERQTNELIPAIRAKHFLVNVAVLKFRSFEQGVTQAGKCLQTCGFNSNLQLLESPFIYSFVNKTRKKANLCVSQFLLWSHHLCKGLSRITSFGVCSRKMTKKAKCMLSHLLWMFNLIL